VKKPRKDELPGVVKLVLEQADEFELLSIDPGQKEKPDATDGRFHGWKVLGKTNVTDFDVRGKLLAAVEQGLSDNTSSSEPGCFEPRHGIRALYAEQTVELVICFQCSKIKVFIDGQEDKTVLTASSPQPTLDKILSDAGVKLAPKKS
jgi:hypothetical protein